MESASNFDNSVLKALFHITEGIGNNVAAFYSGDYMLNTHTQSGDGVVDELSISRKLFAVRFLFGHQDPRSRRTETLEARILQ